jgi:triacylglycerol lipase
MKAPVKIDTEIAAYLATIPKAPVFTAQTLDAIREQRAAMPLPPVSDEVERTDVRVEGNPSVVLRVHRPKGAAGLMPCVYSIHGGGYINGTHLRDDLRFDTWCREFQCVGVSVDYRLSPETPYPGAIDDCYLGLKWTFDNAAKLDIDPRRLGLFGASAGGGLAAALSLLARDRGELPVAFQMLMYPMLDDRQVTASSQWDDVPVWNPTSNEFGWRSYLGDLYGTDRIPPYAAPSRATDLRNLPPAYISVGSLDAFYDEDVEFAHRLSHAGVPTDLHVYAGAPHGFDNPDCPALIAVRARQDASEWLRTRLGP